MEHHRKTSYQGRPSDLSFLPIIMTNCAIGVACRLAFWLLISHPDTALFSAFSLKSPQQSSSLLWYFIPHQHLLLPIPSPPHRPGFMSLLSTSSYLSTPRVHSTMSQPSLALPHCSSLWCFLCLQKIGQERSYIAFPCFECQSHELLSAKKDGA